MRVTKRMERKMVKTVKGANNRKVVHVVAKQSNTQTYYFGNKSFDFCSNVKRVHIFYCLIVPKNRMSMFVIIIN